MTVSTTGGQDPRVVPVLTNIAPRSAGRVAPEVANIWRPNSRTKPAFTADNPVYREALTMTQAGIVVSQIFVGLTVRSDLLSIVTLGLRCSGRMLAAQSLSLVAICAIS